MLNTALLSRAWPVVRKSARTYALGQVAVLCVAALLGLGGGQPQILSANGVSAWQNPLPGSAGAAATLFAALSIVLARAAASSSDRAWRRGGHGLLLGWALFWLVGSARASNADADVLFVVALLLSFVGTLCQAAVSLADWKGEPRAPAPRATPAEVRPAGESSAEVTRV